MKEIQVNKFQSSISFPVPIEKGVYYFEFGYRKKNGDWRKIAFQNLNLGYRIKKVVKNLNIESWFDSRIKIYSQTPHEKAYQLSFRTSHGGSENILYENEDT